MKKLNITLITLLTLLVAMPAGAFVFKSHRYTTANGLPDNDVRTFAQDQRGYMWIGTMNGLSRFDGYSYQTYRPSRSGNNRYLLANDIRELLTWRDRFVVVRQGIGLYSCFDIQKNRFVDYTGKGTYRSLYKRMMITPSEKLVLWDAGKGCNVITYENGRFHSKFYDIQSSRIEGLKLNSVEEDCMQRLWLCTNHGVYMQRNGKLIRQNKSDDMVKMVCSGNQTYFLSSHGDLYQVTRGYRFVRIFSGGVHGIGHALTASLIGNQMIIITDASTYTYNMQTRQIGKTRELQAPGGNIFQDNMGNDIVADKTGMIWYFSRLTGTIIPLKIYTETLLNAIRSYKYNVITARDGKIWVSAYGNGIFVYDPLTRRTTHVTSQTDDGKIIENDKVLSMVLDRQNNVWVSMSLYGMVCLKTIQSPEDFVLIDPNPMSIFNEIHMLTRVNDGRVLVGDMSGNLFLMNGMHRLDKIGSLKGDDYISAYSDRQGRLWLGTRAGGLTIGGTLYQHQSADRRSLGGNRVNNIIQDHRGRQWIALMENGVDLAVPTAKGGYDFRHFFHDIKGVQCRYLLCDHRSRMWLVTTTGIYTFDADSLLRNPHAYHRVKVGSDEDVDIEYRDIYEDSRHVLWVGTRSHGAFMADNTQLGWHFRQVSVEQGLINSSVQSFIDDKHGNVLIFTSNGFSSYKARNGEIHSLMLDNFNERNSFYDHCVAMLPDGWVAVGTVGGVFMTNPRDHQHKLSHKIDVSITKINIDGVPYVVSEEDSLNRDYDDLRSISLASHENNIRIDCSTFDFNNLDNVKYSFYLESHDDKWSPISPENTVTYQNLPPGRYVFHVRVYMNDESLCETEQQLVIEIDPPVYLSWWAILFYVVALTVTGYIVYHQLSTMNRLRNQVTVEKQLTEYKLRFFTNISHEFRTPLTIINGTMEKLSALNQQGNLKAPLTVMQRSVNNMLRLINQLLEFRKMQNNKLHLSLQQGDIIKFVYSVYIDFHEVADGKNINYTFTSPLKDYQMYYDESHLDKILYNLISNAFKYTPKGGSIDLTVNIVDGSLQVAISDTGIGIPLEKRDTLFTRFIHVGASPDSVGIGLNLSYELALNHHGKITYQPNATGGSTFMLTLPTDKKTYAPDDFLSVTPDIVVKQSEQGGFQETYQEFVGEPLNDELVLVVEDDADVSAYLTDLLDEYFHVQTAIDGIDALEKIKAQSPDLILTDMMMPRMNGVELIRKIRSDSEWTKIPVILLTAMHDAETHFKAIDQGADAYLAKPFSPKVLLSYCKRLLQIRNTLVLPPAQQSAATQVLSVSKVSLDEGDRKFKSQIDYLIDKHLSDSEFTVDVLSDIMKIGRTKLFSRIKDLTGITPKAYILERRMLQAVNLLKDGEMTVSEVAYKTGFSSPLYFTKVFKNRYGCTPSDLMRGKAGLQDTDAETAEE